MYPWWFYPGASLAKGLKLTRISLPTYGIPPELLAGQQEALGQALETEMPPSILHNIGIWAASSGLNTPDYFFNPLYDENTPNPIPGYVEWTGNYAMDNHGEYTMSDLVYNVSNVIDGITHQYDSEKELAKSSDEHPEVSSADDAHSEFDDMLTVDDVGE